MEPDEQAREGFIRFVEAQDALDGRYRRIRRLTSTAGNGYFSLLFSAYDETTRQEVALKVFNPARAADGYRVQAFERESRILERLRGQDNLLQIVEPRKVFEHVLQDPATGFSLPIQFSYFVVALGQRSFKDYINSTLWTPSGALGLFREACKGVQRLHRLGICHRDIKPDNLLMFPQRELHISDFGTAKFLGDTEPALAAVYRGPVGDLRYAAPEWLAAVDFGDRSACSADMFALGAVLFEAFTGSVLGQELYTDEFAEFLAHVAAVPERNRREVFDALIGDMAARTELPEMESFTDLVPASVRGVLRRLYRRLVALDYRRRDQDFTGVFSDLNVCIVLARNDMKYRRWLRERKEAGGFTL